MESPGIRDREHDKQASEVSLYMKLYNETSSKLVRIAMLKFRLAWGVYARPEMATGRANRCNHLFNPRLESFRSIP